MGRIGEVGLLPHTTLQGIANKIEKDINNETIIGNCSYDIEHKILEKVFIEKDVFRAGFESGDKTAEKLNALFAKENPVYCFMLEKDYQKLPNCQRV